ncbi:MAG TPA: hypothetical protein VEG38_07510 [Acidimicrobiia bacterium]|nr:hypothetical protein [Acidimicrobiia bacterium]
MAGAAAGRARLSVRRALAAAGFVALGLTVAPAVPSGAAGDYAATASADGVRVGMAVRRFLVVEQFLDAGAPSAQAHVDSLGNSVAWAAYPFPSDLVISVPGTVAGFGPPGLPAVPEYPLYASATYPTRGSAEVGSESFALQAKAEEQAATSSARAGVMAGDVRVGVSQSSSSAARSADAAVRAVGESTVENFAVGDVLRIGRVHSRAEAGTRPGEAVSRTGQTTVAEVTIGGHAVSVGPGGLATPGGNTPLPDGAPARQALADAGVGLRYLAPVETDNGVVAAGLEVTLTREISGVGEAIVSYVLGRATASADAAPDPLTAPGPRLPSPDLAAPGMPGPMAPGATTLPETAPAPPDGAVSLRFGAGSAAPADPGASAIVPSRTAPSARSQLSLEEAATVPVPPHGPTEPPGPSPDAGAALVPGAPAVVVGPGPDFSGFLPILAGGGAVVAGAVITAGRLMRRASWTS